MSTQTYTLRAKMVGAMLREARLSAGISLKDGAAGIGVTSGTLSSYEYGRKPVSLPELELLAFRYDFSLRNFWHPDQFIKHQDENLNPTLLLSLRQRQIAGWLQKQREEAGLTQKELAKGAGISLAKIRAYEKGDRRIPLPELEVIASRLGRTVDDYADKQPPVGTWDSAKRVFEHLSELPQDLQMFIAEPSNVPYLRLAMRLSKVPVDRLRTVGEGLVDITQ
jgi:transcriptional regulator with XRE-family HTH domain